MMQPPGKEHGRFAADEGTAADGRHSEPFERNGRGSGRSLRAVQGSRTASAHPGLPQAADSPPAGSRRIRSADWPVSDAAARAPDRAAPRRDATDFRVQEEPEFAQPGLDAEQGGYPEIDLPGGWKSAATHTRGGGPSWWRILVTVASAIVTGGIFGYLLLALFTGQPLFASKDPAAIDDGAVAAMALPAGTPPESAAAASAGSPPASAAAPSGAASTSGSSAAAAGSQAASASQAPTGSTAVPAADYFMLQYGVFATEDSMNAALKELQDQDVPAASDTTDGFRVYAGIAAAKADAENMAERLPGVQVYVKSVENAKLDAIDSAHAAEWSAYLKSSSALRQKIVELTSAALAGSGQGKANTADIQAVEKAYQTWTDLADQAASWDKAAQDAASIETKQMGVAVDALDQYAGKPSASLLNQAQTAVMKTAIADRQLRETLRLESGS
jgi:hypothetical protein